MIQKSHMTSLMLSGTSLTFLQIQRTTHQRYMITSSGTPIPVIDTNKRRGIRPEMLKVNRRIEIDLRREYSSMYSLMWEIERTFSILEEILHSENIWYTGNRNYDTAIGLKTIAYNLMAMSNTETGDKPREIMKIVSC